MKLLALEVENIKNIKIVPMKLNGESRIIGGENGQGKSSLLDAVMMALGGRGSQVSEPVRRGEEKGSIVLELDKFTIKKEYSANGKSNLVITNKEGAKFPSPQAMLDELTKNRMFDPLAFTRLKPTEQAETLKSLVGIDFSKIDAKRDEIYSERTEKNRDQKALEARLIKLQLHPNVTGPVDTNELLKQLEAARKNNGDKLRAEDDVTYLEKQVNKCSNEIEDLQEEINKLVEKRTRLTRQLQDAEETSKNLETIDDTEIKRQISEASDINQKARENEDYKQVMSDLEIVKARVKKLSDGLETIDTAKDKKLSEASFPIKGLGFNETGVTFRGVPFDQASSAEQIDISVAMGIAMNPDLRLMIIKDGSLLSGQTLQKILKRAEDNDIQMLIERVGSGSEVSLVISEGEVLEDRTQKGKH